MKSQPYVVVLPGYTQELKIFRVFGFYENLYLKKLTEVDTLNPRAECFPVTLWSCISAPKIWLIKSLWFFLIGRFSKFFLKKL